MVSSILAKYKRFLFMLSIAFGLFMVPLIARQFTQTVNWSVNDFIVMGILLLSTSLFCELVVRNIQKIYFRIILVIAVLLLILLIWVELAVGVIGTPFAGN